MTEPNSHDGSENRAGFDESAFLKLARAVLVELRQKVLKEQNSHELTELWQMDIWKLTMPVMGNDLLSALFNKFPELSNNFDISTTAQNLYTLENLEALAGEDGINTVAKTFLQYFAGRMHKRWRVFVEVESLDFGADFPKLGAEDDSVVLRRLEDDERELFDKNFLIRGDRLNSVFFVAVVQAGDAVRAVKKARTNIQRFLVPYYLHRMRNPDGWWRARTQRNILSPVSFYLSGDETGARRELKQLKGRAKDLFLPKLPMDEQWEKTIQSLVSDWDNCGTDSSQLERRLRLCSRWMFAAEAEEDIENAFVKHCVALEALLPGNKLRRSWYLLLLSAGSANPHCIATVAQGERLIDRRNMLVHPEAKGTLWSTIDNNLLWLQQSLYYAFDNTRRIMEKDKLISTNYRWKDLLENTFDAFLTIDFCKVTDKNVRLFLDELSLLNGSTLSDVGEMVRAEALCVKAQERWGKHRKESIEYLARAYQIAVQHQLPLTTLHITLWLKKYIEVIAEEEFKKAWPASSVAIAAPSVRELDAALIASYRDRGIRPEDVGWAN